MLVDSEDVAGGITCIRYNCSMKDDSGVDRSQLRHSIKFQAKRNLLMDTLFFFAKLLGMVDSLPVRSSGVFLRDQSYVYHCLPTYLCAGFCLLSTVCSF